MLSSLESWSLSFDFTSCDVAEIAMEIFARSMDERDIRATTLNGGRRSMFLNVFVLSFSETKDLKSVSFSKVLNEESVSMPTITMCLNQMPLQDART